MKKVKVRGEGDKKVKVRGEGEEMMKLALLNPLSILVYAHVALAVIFNMLGWGE